VGLPRWLGGGGKELGKASIHKVIHFFMLLIRLSIKIIKKMNGAACFKNIDNCLDTNIYSYLATLGGQS
jgi:hypothetical protein